MKQITIQLLASVFASILLIFGFALGYISIQYLGILFFPLAFVVFFIIFMLLIRNVL